MFRNFLKTAFRNITKHKSFSFINISGLTLGLAACLLIGLFVQDEYSYDKFISGGENVYRLYDHGVSGDEPGDRAVTAPMFAPTLHEFPEIEATARVMMLPPIKKLIEAGKHKLYNESWLLADSTFFNVFPLTFEFGTSAKSLDDPASLVLSTDAAELFFPRQDPVGKQLLIDKQPFVIKGVFQKNPKFHLQFDYLMPISAAQLPKERMQSWVWQQFYNYARLKKGTDAQVLQAKFGAIVRQRAAPSSKDFYKDYKPVFQKLADIHLYSAGFKFDVAGRGNITYVRALTIIAIFILLIACFNFVNLATAKSLQRAKEVGVRKSVGAGRKQLMLQFIGETVLYSYISIILSALLVMLLLPWLNQFTGKYIAANLLVNPQALAVLLVLGLITGIVAGFYPALVLSAFKPVRVLKGGASGNETPGGATWFRQALVVAQFTLSGLLMISAIIVFEQVSYLHNKNLGFAKEEIMFFPIRGDKMFKDPEAFKTRLLQVPGVSTVSIGYGFPGDAVAGDEVLTMKNGQWASQSATQLMVDYDYIKTLGITVIAGRDFEKEMKTDKDNAFIINETAVKDLGFVTPQKAIGQKLAWHPWGAANPDSLKTGTVIGVVKDFNYKSLYDKVETAVLQIFPDAAEKVAVKVKTAGMENTIQSVEKAWNEFSPEFPITYNFLDENFEQMYLSEDKLQSLVWIFTCVAIFVGCLGLFGLAAYTAECRKKEIGIRKILGASTQGIVLLLSKNFIKLVIISLLIASPVAWWCMRAWLQNFAYRINIGWWAFAVAAIVAIAIAFATVSFQAIKAALVNPVKNLRTE